MYYLIVFKHFASNFWLSFDPVHPSFSLVLDPFDPSFLQNLKSCLVHFFHRVLNSPTINLVKYPLPPSTGTQTHTQVSEIRAIAISMNGVCHFVRDAHQWTSVFLSNLTALLVTIGLQIGAVNCRSWWGGGEMYFSCTASRHATLGDLIQNRDCQHMHYTQSGHYVSLIPHQFVHMLYNYKGFRPYYRADPQFWPSISKIKYHYRETIWVVRVTEWPWPVVSTVLMQSLSSVILLAASVV